MPAQHSIDDQRKLITTTWSGEAVESELIDALSKYQQTIKCRVEYRSYNEIVDFSNVSDFKLGTGGIVRLVQVATHTDGHGIGTKLAIIVSSPLAYGLGRMYEAYRNLIPGGYKEVRVFKNDQDALEWIEDNASNL